MPSLRMALALHASIPRARPSSQPCPRTPSRQGGSSSGGSPQTKPSRRRREAATARPAPPTPKPLRPPRTTRAFCPTRQQTFDGTTEYRTYPRSVHEGHTAPPIARPTKDVDDERREDDLASLHHKRQQTKPCSPDSPHTLTTSTHTASKGTRRRTLASDLRGPAQNRPPKSTPSCRRSPPESVATTLSLHSPSTPDSTKRDSEATARNTAQCSARPVLVGRTTQSCFSAQPTKTQPRRTLHCHSQSDGLQLLIRDVRVRLQDLPDAPSNLKPPSRAPSIRRNTLTTPGTRPAAAETLTNTPTMQFSQPLGRSARAAGPVHPKLTNSNIRHHARGPSSPASTRLRTFESGAGNGGQTPPQGGRPPL